VSVETTSLVDIGVEDELEGGTATGKQVVVKGALEVAEDLLHCYEMGLSRVMHMEAHLSGRIGDVGLGECEVLESPGQTTVGSRVTDGVAHVRGDLGLSVDRRGAELEVALASTLKDVLSVLVLVQEEDVGVLLH
jgi:hypothetical protein